MHIRRVCSDQDIPTAMILRLHARIGSMDCENQQSFVQYELPCVRSTEPTSMLHGSHLAPRCEGGFYANFFPMQEVRVNLLQMKSAHWSSCHRCFSCVVWGRNGTHFHGICDHGRTSTSMWLHSGCCMISRVPCADHIRQVGDSSRPTCYQFVVDWRLLSLRR